VKPGWQGALWDARIRCVSGESAEESIYQIKKYPKIETLFKKSSLDTQFDDSQESWRLIIPTQAEADAATLIKSELI